MAESADNWEKANLQWFGALAVSMQAAAESW